MYLERAGMYDAVWTLAVPYVVQVTKCDVVSVVAVVIDYRGAAQLIDHRYRLRQTRNLRLFHLNLEPSLLPLSSQSTRAVHLLRKS
jgi:hypothetical protein